MTFYEEQNPKDISISQILPALNKFLPNTNKNDIKFLYHGTYNVFEVKNDFIFRIPDESLRNTKGIQLIQREDKILKLIKPHLSILIPDPVFIDLTRNTPLMGYKKIPGISLSKFIHKIDNTYLIKLAKSIGRFLNQLHNKKLVKIYTDNFGVDYTNFIDSYHDVWEKEYREVKSIVWSFVEDYQKAWIQTLYTRFLSKISDFTFEPTIVHGDFDTSNILVDPISCNLSGIIDFEETKIFDPAVDFLFFREGKLFLNELMATYNGVIDKYFVERMQFTFSRAFIPYILYGANNNIPTLIEAGLQLLSERMTIFP
ncbi:hypothetical protein CEE45_13110 [Candidatus Heimdallarchaeota archaeon B3_Heim]|nr:MAG: hypothetical protein CEE45_13110 [Candidatus Heimdallarchaeota archaeon B3_Heim]